MSLRYNSDENQLLLFSSCVLLNKDIYSVTSMEGIPIKVNLKTGEISYIDKLIKNDFMLTEDMISGEQEIFMLEQNGYRMMSFNLKSGITKFYDISCHRREWGNYAAYAKYKNFIYIFPRYINHMLKIDLETDVIKHDFKLYQELEKLYKYGKSEEDFFYFWCGLTSEDKVWLFQRDKREVFEFDLEKESWQRHILPLKVDFCVNVKKEGNTFYILSSEGKVFTWEIEKNEMRLLTDCGNGGNGSAFSRIVITNKNIVLLPALTDDIYQIDKKTGEKSVYQDYPKQFAYCSPETWAKYSGYCEDTKNYYFAMRSSRFILCINKENGELKWMVTNPPSNGEYFRTHYKVGELIDEREWSLIEVLDYIENGNVYSKKCDIGKQIWNQMRNY